MTRTRRNVWDLPAGDETLHWYGRAIGEMQKRALNNPSSWRFQAAIHEYLRSQDPLAKNNDKFLSAPDRKRFWTQCQHGSWYFLPWHRMYLHFFEKIVAAEVVKLGGPAGWALPYWNYSTSDDARLLPPAFRKATNPDGTKNFLFVAARNPDANAGQQFADPEDVDVTAALTQGSFTFSVLGNFGGPETGFSHGGGLRGALENTPHGNVHGAVGGGGWMSGFTTAGLDPIFWLHHCNLDRLWEVWLRRDAANLNPTSLLWLNSQVFEFFNENQIITQLRCADVIDTTALDYEYQDVSDPLAGAVPAGSVVSVVSEQEKEMENTIPPEMMGATDSTFRVKNAAVRINVPTPRQGAARASRARVARAAAARASISEDAIPQGRVLLQLENLKARGTANSFDVYINVPEGDAPTSHPERRAGRLDLFGIAEASRASADHPGSGLTYSFDITSIYSQLAEQNSWSQDKVDVDLVPVRSYEGSAVTIGRVSLFLG